MPAVQPQFNLVRWFSLASFGTLAVTAVLTGTLLTRFIEDRLLTLDAETARDFVQSVTRSENAEMLSAAAAHGTGLSDGVAEYFAHIAQMPEVVRTNVYGRDGSILWSSDPLLVGRRFGDNDELDDALTGRIVYRRGYRAGAPASTDPKPEHVALPARTFFIESYVPIYGAGSDRPVAVVELYKAARTLEETLNTMQLLVWSSTAAAGLLLFFVLHGIVRKAAAHIEAQQEKLVEVEAMAAVGVMGSAVAHGIRNPLASIRSSAELAADAENCTWREQAEDIIAASDRIERSVRDLLDFTRPASGTAQPVAINAVATDALDGLRRELGVRGLAARLDLDGSDPCILADQAMLGQVVSSLIVNAMEASREHGTVTIVTKLAGDGRSASIRVEDTGYGISGDQLPLVLQPFHTTKPRGLGLGLPLAKRIVERFGGVLEIASDVGRGTVVNLAFPVAR